MKRPIQPYLRNFIVLFALTVLSLGLGSCESVEDVNYTERPVEDIYNEAMNSLMSEKYSESAKLFDEVERQHPYSQWATKGQLMAAFARYQQGEYDEAVIGLDRFIQLHPGNEDVPYAFYLKALCYYEQLTDVSRDQRSTEQALEAFQELERRFPKSDYAKDASPKIDLLLDQLAGKDMTIGRYYQQREHYLAAINRYRSVVENYETTTHVPEAMHRLVENYLILGMDLEARKTAAVLGFNFPNTQWYRDTYGLLSEYNLLDEHKVLKANIQRRAAQATAQLGVDETMVEGDGEDVSTKEEVEEESIFSRAWDWVF